MAGLDSAIATLRQAEAALTRQLEGVRAAISSLVGAGRGPKRGRPTGAKKRGRPKGSKNKATERKRGRRKMSAAGRGRIAAAQKARWAKIRSEKK